MSRKKKKKRQTPLKKKESKLKTAYYIFGILASIAVVLTFILIGIPSLWNNHPDATRYFGIVNYENIGEPVAGATIQITASPESTETLGKGITDSKGNFNIEVKAKFKSAVWVKVEKDGWVGFEGRQIITGGRRIPFEKKP